MPCKASSGRAERVEQPSAALAWGLLYCKLHVGRVMTVLSAPRGTLRHAHNDTHSRTAHTVGRHAPSLRSVARRTPPSTTPLYWHHSKQRLEGSGVCLRAWPRPRLQSPQPGWPPCRRWCPAAPRRRRRRGPGLRGRWAPSRCAVRRAPARRPCRPCRQSVPCNSNVLVLSKSKASFYEDI